MPENITLSKLHQVIQAVFGWSDTHLHEFEIDGESYGAPDPDWGPSVISEQRKKLISVLYGKKSFRYVYDFGNNWELRIKVEKPCLRLFSRKCRAASTGPIGVRQKILAVYLGMKIFWRRWPIRIIPSMKQCRSGMEMMSLIRRYLIASGLMSG